jgi:2,4-didehydro-3-deoxy-L-rhamnonate hydrolase
MRFYCFESDGTAHLGVGTPDGKRVLDLAAAAPELPKNPLSEALEHVFGYTILHDVSARDVQFRHNQITLGKNFDSFCPIGPCVVTRDEIPRPDRIRLKTFLNGETMQDASTSDWLFSLPRLLSFLSQRMTLEPGDIVSTGTPAGVGVFRKPPIFLKPGDVVRLEADQIGVLQNSVTRDDERTQ